MKRKVAHVLRRTARMLIRQSNKLDPPHLGHVHVAIGHAAGKAFAANIAVAAAEERLAKARRDQARGIYVAPKLRPL
ncbi:hypothetical protein AB0876_28775 [Mycobacterium sp. NPDC049093]